MVTLGILRGNAQIGAKIKHFSINQCSDIFNTTLLDIKRGSTFLKQAYFKIKLQLSQSLSMH